MGKSNYADWVTQHKMAGSAQAVNRFPDDARPVEALERKELERVAPGKRCALVTPTPPCSAGT